MEKEKVVVFLDYADVNRAAGEKRYRPDYADLLRYVSEGRLLMEAYGYVPLNPRNEHRLDREIEELWRAGYLVTTKMGTITGGTYRCNFDVEITLDLLKALYQVKPDIIVLASGNANFLSLLQEIRKAGVRIEVAAFPDAIGAGMLLKCSGFIDLSVYYESYLVAHHDEPGEEKIDTRYKDLIQSQKSVQDEHGKAKQGLALLPARANDLKEEVAASPADAEEKQPPVHVPDIINDLGNHRQL
ncbi:MAG TPA: NYN domain-containing protein [Ktedonobacteraceae bacterium]